MKDNKQRISLWLEENGDDMVKFLQRLVAVPSDNPPGDCEPIARCVSEALREYGFSPAWHPVGIAETEAAGMIRAANVVAAQRFGSQPEEGVSILLNAHGDVVAPGMGWSKPPYGGEIHDGSLYGRGAAVSKSDIAAYTFALRALREAGGLEADGQVTLAFTFDEETGGEIGPRLLLERGLLPRADAAICAGFTHSIVTAHNGCLHLEVEVVGRSAHAAIPQTGLDAIETANAILTALYASRSELVAKRSCIPGIGSPTLNVGTIAGGINTNVVPDRCVFRLDRRLIPEELPDEVENELRLLIEKAAADSGAEVNVRTVLRADNFGPTPADHALVTSLRGNAERLLGKEVPIEGVPLYADARHFARAGIPTVMFGAGPRTLEEACGHRADERVKLSDLAASARIVALTLYDLLTGGREALQGLESSLKMGRIQT